MQGEYSTICRNRKLWACGQWSRWTRNVLPKLEDDLKALMKAYNTKRKR